MLNICRVWREVLLWCRVYDLCMEQYVHRFTIYCFCSYTQSFVLWRNWFVHQRSII